LPGKIYPITKIHCINTSDSSAIYIIYIIYIIYTFSEKSFGLTGNSQHPQTLSLRLFLRKLRVFWDNWEFFWNSWEFFRENGEFFFEKIEAFFETVESFFLDLLRVSCWPIIWSFASRIGKRTSYWLTENSQFFKTLSFLKKTLNLKKTPVFEFKVDDFLIYLTPFEQAAVVQLWKDRISYQI